MKNNNLLTIFFVKLLIATSLFSSDVLMDETGDSSVHDSGKNVPSPRTLVESGFHVAKSDVEIPLDLLEAIKL